MGCGFNMFVRPVQPPAGIGRIISPDKAGRRRQYPVHGKAAQRRMAEKDG